MSITFNWTNIDLSKRDEQLDALAWEQGDTNWQDIMDALNTQIAPAITAIINALSKPGDMKLFGGGTIESGWLECNGQEVSRATYSDLFAAIGTTWGVGNGTTTFNLPDSRSRVPMGKGQGAGLTNRTLGTLVGTESTTHNHTVSGSVSNNGPTGVVTENTELIPTGDITVDNTALTPTGNITIDNTALSVEFSNIAPHTDLISENAPGHTHDVIVTGMANNYEEGAAFNPAEPKTYVSEPTQVTIDLAATPLNHTGTQDLSHNHTGSFLGNSQNHNHTGTFTGDSDEHNHNIEDAALSHSHTYSANTSTVATGTIQPSFVSTYIIKY